MSATEVREIQTRVRVFLAEDDTPVATTQQPVIIRRGYMTPGISPVSTTSMTNAAARAEGPAANSTPIRWNDITDQVAARRAVLVPLGIITIVLLSLTLNPLDAWWVWGFRGLRLYLWWPLA